jgi:YD repeat-containing protein
LAAFLEPPFSPAGTLSGSSTTYASGAQACADGSTGNVCYAPQGAIANLKLYNGVTESWGFNALLQPGSETVANAGGTPLMTLGWTYNTGANNGNVAGRTIQRSTGLSSASTVLSQSFSYVDPANRLSSAQEAGGWQQTYLYDAFGNRAVAPSSWIPSPGFTPQHLTEFNGNNQ